MRGGEVFILQEFLQKYGWGIPNNGPVTGYFGSVTATAVMAFQKAKGLPSTGIVGPKTRGLINGIIDR
jgi:peptidoglycan hydrolase-like protein with peptidoglycan-binding domain